MRGSDKQKYTGNGVNEMKTELKEDKRTSNVVR